jgi:hypothetical protein
VPITDDQRLLIGIVNSVSWAIVYGALGLLLGYLRDGWFKNEATQGINSNRK